MTKKNQFGPEGDGAASQESGQTLRQRAEEVFRGKDAGRAENLEALPPEEARQMLYELQVHQIELELQNDELRFTQGELEASRARYFDLYDLAPVGYFTLSETGLILEINLAAANILGVARGGLVKRQLTNFILPDDQDIYYGHRKLLFETGTPQVCEIRIVRADAAPCWVRIDAVAAEDADGTPACRATMIDIAKRKQVEEALQESESKYRNIFENAMEGIYQSTPEGRFITANAAFAQMAGYDSPEELISSIEDIGTQLYVRPEDRKRFQEIMTTSGIVKGFEVDFFKKNGSIFWVLINSLTIKDDQGEILYYEGIIEDITLRKQAEEQLHNTLDSLRRAFNAIVQVLVAAVETRDPYTSGHQLRSADLARAIATEMGLPQNRIDGIRMAGAIHDIGKMSVPAEILSKPTKLTELEFSLIKEHANKGFEMLKDVESPWSLAEIVYQHHERLDGSGYPRGLKGEEILMEACILAVADVVESMASHRPYRPALGLNAALAEIENNKGTLYDADAVEACLRIFREKGFQFEKTCFEP